MPMKLGISALELHEEGHSMSWAFTPRAFASARMVLGLGRLPFSADTTVVLATSAFRANSAWVSTARILSSRRLGMCKNLTDLGQRRQ